MKVKLIKRSGEQKELSLIFSWKYLVFGPFYYLFSKMVGRFLLLSAIYVLGLWKNCGAMLVKLLTSIGLNESLVSFLEIPGNHYWITLGVIVGLHIVMCFVTPKIVVKKLIHKRGYLPYSEIDAQLLVKHSLTKVGTMCYLANFKAVNGVQGKIKIENTVELEKKLEELAKLLKEGMITKDEYNTKRAEALMNVSSKK